MSKKPSVVLMVEPNSHSRLEMAKIWHFMNGIQVSLNYSKSEIFEIFSIDELYRSPKKAYFCCVIGT